MIERRVGDVRVVFTDRHGGVSAAPYDSLNLGDHVGDEAKAVAANRARVAHGLGLPGTVRWCFLRQVHGATVATATAPSGGAPPEADAAVTTVPGLPLVVLTADCAPIALCAGHGVAVVHAGRTG